MYRIESQAAFTSHLETCCIRSTHETCHINRILPYSRVPPHITLNNSDCIAFHCILQQIISYSKFDMSVPRSMISGRATPSRFQTRKSSLAGDLPAEPIQDRSLGVPAQAAYNFNSDRRQNANCKINSDQQSYVCSLCPWDVDGMSMACLCVAPWRFLPWPT